MWKLCTNLSCFLHQMLTIFCSHLADLHISRRLILVGLGSARVLCHMAYSLAMQSGLPWVCHTNAHIITQQHCKSKCGCLDISFCYVGKKKIKTCKVCKVSTFQNILTSGVFVVQNFICHNLQIHQESIFSMLVVWTWHLKLDACSLYSFEVLVCVNVQSLDFLLKPLCRSDFCCHPVVVWTDAEVISHVHWYIQHWAETNMDCYHFLQEFSTISTIYCLSSDLFCTSSL